MRLMITCTCDPTQQFACLVLECFHANRIHRDAIHRGAKTLNQLGKAMGEEIDSQNKHIDRIITKTDKVDDQIAVNRARLDRIR